MFPQKAQLGRQTPERVRERERQMGKEIVLITSPFIRCRADRSVISPSRRAACRILHVHKGIPAGPVLLTIAIETAAAADLIC